MILFSYWYIRVGESSMNDDFIQFTIHMTRLIDLKSTVIDLIISPDFFDENSVDSSYSTGKTSYLS